MLKTQHPQAWERGVIFLPIFNLIPNPECAVGVAFGALGVLPEHIFLALVLPECNWVHIPRGGY